MPRGPRLVLIASATAAAWKHNNILFQIQLIKLLARHELIILSHCSIILFFNSPELYLLFSHLHSIILRLWAPDSIILKIFRLGNNVQVEDSDPLHMFGLSLTRLGTFSKINCRGVACTVNCRGVACTVNCRGVACAVCRCRCLDFATSPVADFTDTAPDQRCHSLGSIVAHDVII